MRKTTSAILALCALAAQAGRADDPEPDTTKAELKKLQGTWVMTKTLVTGEQHQQFYKFEGDKLSRWAKTGERKDRPTFMAKFTVKIDTKKKPHTITLIRQVGKTPMISQVGNYKIEKGQLYLALGTPEKPPKDFKAEAGRFYVMTREKDKEKAKEKGKK